MKYIQKKILSLRARRDMFNALQVLKNQSFATQFTHAAARNRSRLTSHMDALQEAGKPVEGYNEAQATLAREMARKDGQGKPMEHPNGGWIVIDEFNHNRRLEELKAKLGQDKVDAAVEELLEGEEEFKVSMVEEKFLPPQMSLGVVGGLLPMIEPAAGSPTKLELTKGEIDEMYRVMHLMMTEQQPTAFVLKVARNREILLPYQKKILERKKPVEGFEARRVALAQELARKDTLGQPLLTTNGRDYLVTDQAIFEQRLKIIKEETGQDAKDVEDKQLFAETVEVEVFSMTEEDLPPTMSAEVLEGFLPIIVDSEEDETAADDSAA